MQGEQNTPLLPRKSYFIFNLEDQFVFYSMSSIESICHAMASSLHGRLPAHQATKPDSKLPSLKASSCVLMAVQPGNNLRLNGCAAGHQSGSRWPAAGQRAEPARRKGRKLVIKLCSFM
ncbi:hypothetical protein PCASD_07087 [Puccinia coronata f. sp. avenae]|uniref:Uncharacterized protein n=1 Tax=Puccinia coronata f. sp. avenae TaxID=200324 RepID=A0A2N5V6W7_9BASI|nr:hypothetical protein PCASD_07087 [Puccinia coronata f. sp. avenae]